MANPREIARSVRKPGYGIGDIFYERWSPRAMSGEEIPDGELMALFEAARWAPSSNNLQPWRFVYSKRGSSSWNDFLAVLYEGNREWCVNASALVMVVSKKTKDDGSPYRLHAFGAGSAFENFLLEGSRRGLVVHGMGGLDYGKAAVLAGLSGEYELQCMAAVGRPAGKEVLSEKQRERENPSQRKPLSEIAFEGRLKK